MKGYVIDTCDVTFRHRGTQNVIFTASAQLASVSQSVETEEVKGGIGSQTQFTVRSDKALTLSVRDALFDSEWVEMQQGASFRNGVVKLTQKEDSLIVADGKITIEGTPDEGKLIVYNEEGAELVMEDVAAKEITIDPTFAKNGDTLMVIYENELEGRVLDIDGDKFPESYEVEYHTIEYSKATDMVMKDIYFKFFNVSPSGEFELGFENGTPIAPEMSFTCKSAPNSNKIGVMVEVPRVAKP